MAKKGISDSEKVEKLASNFTSAITERGLPPIFGDGFAKGNLTWEKLDDLDFESIGRILVCHLLIEIYINKLIELLSPKSFDFNNVSLSFAQKLKIIANCSAFKNHDFRSGLETINKIRNRYSHNVRAKVEYKEIEILKTILKNNEKSDKRNIELIDAITNNIVIMENFTSLFCSYIGGYCSALAENYVRLL